MYETAEVEKKAYLTKGEGERLVIPYGYKQTFEHEMRFMQTPREYDLVRNFYIMEEELQAIEMEILKFLRDFCFGTEQQFRILLGAKGLNPDFAIDVLEACVKNHVLNYFVLGEYVMDNIPDDAFRVYCLDHGARHVLTHFSQRDYLTWLSSDNIRSSELIYKYLMTGMFYLQLVMVKGDRLRNFNSLADFSLGRRDVRFSCTFQIMDGFNTRDFILEVVRSDDVPIAWQEKVDQKIAPFYKDELWKRYFANKPALIILAENGKDAFEIADIYYRRVESTEFRLMTDASMMKDIAIVHSYVPQSETNPKAALKKGRAKVFSEE